MTLRLFRHPAWRWQQAALIMALLALMAQSVQAQNASVATLEEAVVQANASNKPILLWLTARWSGESHAMRLETMAQEEVKAALHRDVIFLEIDRDEQPALDAGLQATFAAINGRAGGYPLTVFCTPQGDPFEALGYVPGLSEPGRPGLAAIISQVANLWRQDQDRILRHAMVLRDHVLVPPPSTARPVPLTRDTVLAIAQAAADSITTGGMIRLGSAAVPLPSVPIMLAAAGQSLGDRSAAAASERVLNAVLRGPLRDHMQGGYFRSAVLTPEGLRVQPEKLLSVQAAWLRAFAAAHMQSQRGRHVEAVGEVLRFTRAQMDIPEGGWKAFLPGMTHLPTEENPWFWSGADLRAVPGLASRDADVLEKYLGLSTSRRGVPAPVSLLDPVARNLGMSYDAANSALIRARAQAAAHRQKSADYPRASQLRILQWEGAAITAYILASRVTNQPALQDHALASARRIALMDVGADGTLPRMVLDGRPVVPGSYADYAQIAEALLNAGVVSEDKNLIEKAKLVLQRGESLRESPATTGSLTLIRGGERLWASHDGELSSPLSVAAATWMVLDTLEPGKGYLEKAQARIAEIFAETRRGRAGAAGPAEAGAGWTLIAMLASAPESQ